MPKALFVGGRFNNWVAVRLLLEQYRPSKPRAVALCLKEDRIRLYDVSADGELSIAEQSDLYAVDSAGMRHMDFYPNQRFAYYVNELNSTVDVIELHSVAGKRVLFSLWMPCCRDLRISAGMRIFI